MDVSELERKLKIYIVSDGYRRLAISDSPQCLANAVNIMINDTTAKTFNISTVFMTKKEYEVELKNLKRLYKEEMQTIMKTQEINAKTENSKILTFPSKNITH